MSENQFLKPCGPEPAGGLHVKKRTLHTVADRTHTREVVLTPVQYDTHMQVEMQAYGY